MEVSLCPALHSRLKSLALVETGQSSFQESEVKSLLPKECASHQEDEQISELLKKGLILSDNRKYDEAEAIFADIISILEKLNPTFECAPYLCEAYNNLGLIQYKKVEFNKALSSYDKSIQVNGSFAPAFYNQGTIYYRLGFYEAALEKMSKAVSLQPTNAEFQKGFQATLKILKNHPWMNSPK